MSGLVRERAFLDLGIWDLDAWRGGVVRWSIKGRWSMGVWCEEELREGGGRGEGGEIVRSFGRVFSYGRYSAMGTVRGKKADCWIKSL